MALIPQKLLLDLLPASIALTLLLCTAPLLGLAVALELAFQISLVIRFLFFSVITVTEHRYLLSFQKSRQIQFLDFFSADRDYLARWLMFGDMIRASFPVFWRVCKSADQ